jgi:hypothetical protein
MDRNGAIRMVNELQNLHNRIGQLFDEFGLEPFSGSKASLELRDFQRPESVKAAYDLGSALIEVAADHVIAFTKTVTEPVQTIAPWTCVRAAVEASAIASWLLDPPVDVRERVCRSFAFRYEGLIQQTKYARSLGLNSDVNKIQVRIDELEKISLDLGFSRVVDEKGRRIGIAQIMPSITQIVNSELGEESTYRLLSAAIHAHFWALVQLSFKKAQEEEPIIEKHLNPLSVSWLCFKVARVFVRPVWYKCLLFGWDSSKLVTCLETSFDALGIKNVEERFWRTEK